MEQSRLQQKVHTVKPRGTTQTRVNYFPTNSNKISFLLIKKLLKITPITLLGCHATGSSFCIISKNTTKSNTGKHLSQFDFNHNKCLIKCLCYHNKCLIMLPFLRIEKIEFYYLTPKGWKNKTGVPRRQIVQHY